LINAIIKHCPKRNKEKREKKKNNIAMQRETRMEKQHFPVKKYLRNESFVD